MAQEVDSKDVLRFLVKVAVRQYALGCWEWQSWENGVGYGRFFYQGKDWYAHRWAYYAWVGPIPEGLVIDHLCRNTICVNPDHLEAVTQQENILRSEPAQRTHCPQGHLYPMGKRRCTLCNASSSKSARLKYGEQYKARAQEKVACPECTVSISRRNLSRHIKMCQEKEVRG